MATAALTNNPPRTAAASRLAAKQSNNLARLFAAPIGWLARRVQAAKGVIYPPLCLVCDADLEEPKEFFCPKCLAQMVLVDQAACVRCASRVGLFVDTSQGCLACRGQRHRFDAAIRLGIYEGKLRDTCLNFKSVHNELLGPALARLFMKYQRDALRAAHADVVVSVPLHFTRRFWRGFNQAESIARCLAGELNLPHRSRILKRVRRTKPQSELKRDERRGNVRDAFRARTRADLKGATVLLVDDILTTGATCSEAAQALKAAGAARVVVAVVARSQE